MDVITARLRPLRARLGARALERRADKMARRADEREARRLLERAASRRRRSSKS